jgi:hypothetical protein
MGAQPQYRDLVQPEIVAIDILSFGEAPPTASPLEPSPTLAQPSRSYPEELTAFEICECPPDEAWVLDPQYRG